MLLLVTHGLQPSNEGEIHIYSNVYMLFESFFPSLSRESVVHIHSLKVTLAFHHKTYHLRVSVGNCRYSVQSVFISQGCWLQKQSYTVVFNP